MNIRTRLFGPAWEHRDPAIRVKAIAEEDLADLREALPRIAEHDEDARVRLAALKRIDSEPFWLDARLRETDPEILQAADTYLARAIMRGGDQRLISERVEWFRRIDDPELVRRAACHAPDRAIRAEALARIDAPGFLGDRIIEESDEELALAQVDRIEQISTLRRIATALRKKSKRRAQAVEQRLAKLQAAEGSLDAGAAAAEPLVQRAEAMARGALSDDPAADLESLRDEWAAMPSPPQSLQRRFEGAVAIVGRALAAPTRQRGQAAEAVEAAEDRPDAALLDLVERLERMDGAQPPSSERSAELLGRFDRCWNAITEPGPADLALRERALPILRKLQKLRQEHPAKAEQTSEPPREVQPDWNAQLDAIATQLEAGHLAEAQAAVRAVRQELDRLPPKQRPRAVTGRLGRLEGRLREMRQWEHWSNNKIRDELIERIESLAAAETHPDAVSAALKEARAEWQRLESLEVLPGDKRQHAAPAGQWRRFQAACKNAFEQAQPYFEKRHEVQAENLEQLEAFLERGQSVVDADDSDIDTLKQSLKLARLAIRRLDDLPPKTRGRSAARLRELMDALSNRLDSAFERIETAKRGLIREAQALQHESDLKSAIDQAKALQARWQKAGTGRRRIEQQLWQEFRAPIDPLFDKLRGEQDERREAREAENAALRELVEAAEQLAAIDDETLDQAEGRMKTLRADWQAAGHRPARLAERFARAEQRLEQRLDERRQAERRHARKRLDELAGQVQSAWQARQNGETPAAEPPEAEGEDEASHVLIDAARCLSEAELDIEAMARQVAENGDRARQVLIEMEFLAGLDSPPEDREARMNFQVERLARRMAEHGTTPGLAEELAALRERWYASFPQPTDQHEAMAKRFGKCQNALDSMSGTQ